MVRLPTMEGVECGVLSHSEALLSPRRTARGRRWARHETLALCEVFGARVRFGAPPLSYGFSERPCQIHPAEGRAQVKGGGWEARSQASLPASLCHPGWGTAVVLYPRYVVLNVKGQLFRAGIAQSADFLAVLEEARRPSLAEHLHQRALPGVLPGRCAVGGHCQRHAGVDRLARLTLGDPPAPIRLRGHRREHMTTENRVAVVD
jgi:hypothetical protein